MKYYFTLVCLFLVLFGADLYLANLFAHANISVALVFVLAVAFLAPQKTRFVYRTLIPIIFLCGFTADSLSAVSPGIVFLAYFFMALFVLTIAKNIPRADSVGMLALVIFFTTLVYGIFIGLAVNHFSGIVVLALLAPSLLLAVCTTAGATIVAYFFETPFGEGVGKILFNTDL